MNTTIQHLFPVCHLLALKNPPDREIYGFVYVMPHWDELENYQYWSINYQSPSGDTGWQSNRIYTRDEANAAAEVLADWCKAEVVWP